MQKKLSQLRAIEPSPEIVDSIRTTIDLRLKEREVIQKGDVVSDVVAVTKKHQKSNEHILSPYMRKSIYATSLLVFVFAFYVENPFMVRNVVVFSRVAVAPHAHAKSEVALNELEYLNTKGDLFRVRGGYDALEKTIKLNRLTLDTLSLMGEKGTYSQDDCLSDYKKYYNLLLMLDKKLKSEVNNDKVKTVVLQEKIHDAIEEAEERLGSYPKN